MTTQEKDKTFIRKCITLSQKSLENGDAPFGAIITKDGEIIAEATNESQERVYDHAEVLALDKAHKKLKTSDLSWCTLYSNCEPCPMCAFMAREYKISKVVFAMPSPFMGGYTKWNILEDKEIAEFKPFFGPVPEVISGLLEEEAKKIFDKTLLRMFGKNPKKI